MARRARRWGGCLRFGVAPLLRPSGSHPSAEKPLPSKIDFLQQTNQNQSGVILIWLNASVRHQLQGRGSGERAEHPFRHASSAIRLVCCRREMEGFPKPVKNRNS